MAQLGERHCESKTAVLWFSERSPKIRIMSASVMGPVSSCPGEPAGGTLLLSVVKEVLPNHPPKAAISSAETVLVYWPT